MDIFNNGGLMRKRIVASIVISGVVLALIAVWRPESGAAKAEIIGNPQSRYVLTPVQGVHQDVGGGATNTVIKLDNVTGETWVLHPQGWKVIKGVP